MKKLIPQPIKNIYHLLLAMAANFYYGVPSRKIKVIGVTGTNGKTTTCQMVAKILETAGRKVAMASTINFKIDKEEWVNDTKFTTLSAWAVQKFIKRSVATGCEYVVLETSSHSLDQYRVWGIKYRTAVITNVTREHLDYHSTMDRYRRAKLRLFKNAEIAVVNLDMENPKDFLRYDNRQKITYSLKDSRADAYAADLKMQIERSNFLVRGQRFVLHLAGDFNVENALAAISVSIGEKIKMEDCALGLSKVTGVPGRLERVDNDRKLNIIIDYAVTPDSLEKLYGLLKKIFGLKARIIAVFGACGERDRGKRPLMGEVVARYADLVIVTNEDPYGEEPMGIIEEVASGVKNKELGKNFWKVLDRREAIRKALQLVQPGDVLVVTGKGAEETMAVGRKRLPWNDKKVIIEELQN